MSSVDWSSKSAAEIVEELSALVAKIGNAPAPKTMVRLVATAPIRRTRTGAWRTCGRRFGKWVYAFEWLAARGRVFVDTRAEAKSCQFGMDALPPFMAPPRP